MTDMSALKAALSLHRSPARVKEARKNPLPAGMTFLLRIISNDRQAIREAEESCGRSSDVVIQAATFFVEQILFAQSADVYRILGADAFASQQELRVNMALLVRWLHDEAALQTGRAIYTSKVTDAWNHIKTPERKDAYEKTLSIQLPARRAESGSPRPTLRRVQSVNIGFFVKFLRVFLRH